MKTIESIFNEDINAQTLLSFTLTVSYYKPKNNKHALTKNIKTYKNVEEFSTVLSLLKYLNSNKVWYDIKTLYMYFDKDIVNSLINEDDLLESMNIVITDVNVICENINNKYEIEL